MTLPPMLNSVSAIFEKEEHRRCENVEYSLHFFHPRPVYAKHPQITSVSRRTSSIRPVRRTTRPGVAGWGGVEVGTVGGGAWLTELAPREQVVDGAGGPPGSQDGAAGRGWIEVGGAHRRGQLRTSVFQVRLSNSAQGMW